MSIYDHTSAPNRPLGFLAGLLLCLAGTAILWFGITSFQIGLAYYLIKGSWLPKVVGILCSPLGLVLLYRGVSLVHRSLRPHLYENQKSLQL